MRLSELEPEFLKIDRRPDTWTIRKEDNTEEQVSGLRTYFIHVDSLEEADGISFLCPLCFKNNNGPIGTHGIMCWRHKIPLEDYLTGPGRWEPTTGSFETMSLIGKTSNSVLLQGGCNAHFTITNGNIEWNM